MYMEHWFNQFFVPVKHVVCSIASVKLLHQWVHWQAHHADSFQLPGHETVRYLT